MLSHGEDFQRLVISNLKEFVKHIPILHSDFDKIFSEFPDYFNMKNFNQEELKIYNRLEEYIEYWQEHPLPTYNRNIRSVFIKFADEKQKELNNTAYKFLSEIQDEVNIQTNGSIHDAVTREHLLPIAYETENPFCLLLDPFKDPSFLGLLLGIAEFQNIVDSFWLIPVYEGKVFTKIGYKISNYTLEKIANENYSGIAWGIINSSRSS